MYDAFISYSHRADRLTAPTLQKGLENLNRRWLGRRRLRIFRDETDLSVAPSLWGVIQEALDSSRFFILLASPEAAASKWVGQEVKQWIATKPKNTLLLVVTSGNYQWDEARRDFDSAASSAIPPAMFGVFSEEPLLLDLRATELRGHRRADSQAAIATLAAPIHGKSKEELLGLEVQLFRRRMIVMIGALVSIAVLAAGFLWQSVEARRQRDTARVERNHAQAQLSATQSTLALEQRRAPPAFWRAADAWALDPTWISQKALYDFARSGLHTTFDHGSEVFAASISRDGKYAFTTGVGVKMWKTDGSQIFSVGTGATSGDHVDIAPDGSGALYVIAGVHVLSMTGSNQLELPLASLEDRAWFSPDSLSLVTVANAEPIRRYNRTGQFLNEYRTTGSVVRFAVSPDGSKIAAGTDRGELHLWNTDSSVIALLHDQGRVTSIQFSSDGSKLLTATREGKLTLLGADRGTSQVVLEHKAIAAAISPTGEHIGVLLRDGTVRALDYTGRVIRTFEDEDNPVSAQQLALAASKQRFYSWLGGSEGGAVRFSRGGKNLVVSAHDVTQVWDFDSGRLIRTIPGNLLSASAEGQYFVTTGSDSALLWETDGAARSEIRQPSGFTGFDLASTGGAIVTTSFDGSAKVWDEGGQVTLAVAHGAPGKWAGLSHDRRMLMTVGRDNAARLWSQGGVLLKELRHSDIVNHAAFAPDDQQIVTSSADGTAAIWNTSGNRMAVLDHKAEVYCAAFSPDGRWLATGASNRSVRLWNQSGKLIWEHATGDNLQKVAFTPDGRRLVAMTTGRIVWVLDAATGRPLSQLKHPEELMAAELAPSGMVVTSALDRVVRVWTLEGRLLAELPHVAPVTSVTMSRDGMRVLTGSDDGRARLWDLTGNELLAFTDQPKIQQVAFSTDGDSVVTLSSFGVRTWRFGSPVSILEHYRGSIMRPTRPLE